MRRILNENIEENENKIAKKKDKTKDRLVSIVDKDALKIIFVEKRVVLKCRGCIGYGKKLTCPPHVPSVDEFREILKEYRYAMLVSRPFNY